MDDVKPISQPNPPEKPAKMGTPPPTNTPYAVTGVVMLILSSALSFGLHVIRPEVDYLLIIGAVFGISLPTTAAILAFLKSQETHLAVNSRLDAWIAGAEALAHLAGMREARSEDVRATVLPAAVTLTPKRIAIEIDPFIK